MSESANKSTARDRIVGTAEGSLGETIYAGAGAGTGKTKALVERIANLLTYGGVKPENIAAITFTNAAASELRQRVRGELEERHEEAVRGGETTDQVALGSALEKLDSAYIGTIHSFAQSLLKERPLDVGLPPVFEVLDPVQGDALFDEEWDEWLDGALADPPFAEAVINAQRLGLRTPLATLRVLAGELHANYDIVDRFGMFTPPAQAVDHRQVLESVQADLSKALDLRQYCTNPNDKLLGHLGSEIELATEWIDEAIASELDEEQILALTQLPKLTVGGGRKGDWTALPGGESSLEEVRALLKAAQATVGTGRQAIGEATVVPLVNAVAEMVLGYAQKRKSEGVLEFQDLLVLSCDLLANSSETRKYFQARYTHVLIDEFQDTDPLQLKLAMLLADRESDTGRGKPTPGALFVVGDGKQSIYRFRRADLTQLQGLIDSLGATPLSLSTNYRSDAGILDWVNAVFEPWMNGPDGAAGSERDPNQAEYVALEPGRAESSDSGSEIPRVMITGGPAEGNVDEARTAEANDIARLAVSVGAGEWTLANRDGETYRSKYRDLCVLMPRRTALPHLEAAFEDHSVPYVLEGQSPIFESQTFHELSNNLAAIDDPTDQVAIVAALKSVAWGCSDQDLFEWARLKHKFEYARDRHEPGGFAEGSGARRVATALAGLAVFHDIRQQHSTPYLIEKFIRERRLREVAALMDESGDREQLMDLFIEMSRSLQRSGTGSLREFVRWIARQAEAGVRVAEGALANSEINRVRVMTIYAAKGLEFPVVALAGMQVGGSAPKGNSISKEKDGNPVLAIKLGAKGLGLTTGDYESVASAEKDADVAEQVRLAYVGATRAREHLVVSVHRSAKDKSTVAAKISEFADLCDDLWEPFEVGSGVSAGVGPGRNGEASAGSSSEEQRKPFSLEDRARWIQDVEEKIAAASGRGYVTPSQLADHTMFEHSQEDEPEKPDDNMESTELDAARRGRGGTNIGSAVHAVLQDINLDDHSNLGDLVRMAAEAHDVPGENDQISQLVRNVMASPIMANATEQTCWREAWVAAEIEIEPGISAEVEGAIDLIIQHDDGSVSIVDYKTDQVVGADLRRRAKGYEPQLAGYALVVEKQGFRVRDAVLIFARGESDTGAFEYRVEDIEKVKLNARAAIRNEIG